MAICVVIALIAALAAGLVANAVLGDDDTASAPSSGLALSNDDDRPDPLGVELLTTDGQPTTLADELDGKPLVVNLWAQNCAPCVKEMPLLEQAAQDNPHLTVLGVDTQDVLAKAEQMAAKTGITYRWFQDPEGNFFYAARAAGMPTTLAMSPEGEVLASHTGAFKDQAELQRWIDTYLGRAAATSSTSTTAAAGEPDGTTPP